MEIELLPLQSVAGQHSNWTVFLFFDFVITVMMNVGWKEKINY